MIQITIAIDPFIVAQKWINVKLVVKSPRLVLYNKKGNMKLKT